MIILGRYIGITVIVASLVALLAIVSLDLIFALVDGVAGADRAVGDVLVEALLGAPRSAYEAFPFATLIGSLMGLGGLAARNELMAMRAAGVSVLQIAGAAMAGGLILAVVATGVGEWVVPQAEAQAASARGLSEGDQLRAGPGGELWVRDGRELLRVEQPRARDHLDAVTLYRFEGDELVERREVTTMRYGGDGWILRDVTVLGFGPDGVTREHMEQAQWAGALDPTVLGVVVRDPEALPMTQLLTYVRYLERNELDSDRYRLALWVKVATPLATLAMILVTVPLIFVAGRSAGAGQRIVLGVLVGTAFFLLNRAMGQAGVVYGVPPSLSALLPVALFFALGLWGTLRTR